LGFISGLVLLVQQILNHSLERSLERQCVVSLYAHDPRLLTASLTGGLGNQMVIFECIMEYAGKFGLTPAFLESELDRLNKVFNMSALPLHHLVLPDEPWQARIEKWDHFDIEAHTLRVSQNRSEDINVHGYRGGGYYQESGKFIELTRNRRPKEFWRFSQNSVDQAASLLKKHKHWVALHYRHYPQSHFVAFHDALPTPAALKNVIRQAIQCKETPATTQECPEYCVMVFSNDFVWAENMTKGSAPCMYYARHETKRNSDWEGQETNLNLFGRDLAAMAMAEKLILTSGTYSMFAGLLHSGGGHVFQANGQDRFVTRVLWYIARANRDAKWVQYRNNDGSLIDRPISDELTEDDFFSGFGISRL